MKSCLANRQYNQYFKSLNKSISEYLGISPFYFILLQNNLQGGVTTQMSLTHNTRQWLQNAKKKHTELFNDRIKAINVITGHDQIKGESCMII